MERTKAETIAIDVCRKLQPFCDRINIAGSIRRRKIVVKDIEVIAMPKIIRPTNLFGEKDQAIVNNAFIKTVDLLGRTVKGKPRGKHMEDIKQMKIDLPQGITLDLFIPDRYDYYRQLAIRTGSLSYSQNVIAAGWLTLGWCGSDKGLRKQDDCERIKVSGGKHKWVCVNPDAELPPVWESEEAFFEWLKIPYKQPVHRL